jgi:diguanylate cyclase (GGDEF)-like protein
MAAILIVEDGPVNRRFLATLLHGHGHRVLDTGDGEEALGIVRTEKPDLVLVDVLTPGIDGYQFFVKLHAECGVAPPRVIFRAATHMEAEARALAETLGAFFVAKPVDPQTLLATVDAVLSGPQPSPRLSALPVDNLLRPVARKADGHAANLEKLNARLDRRITEASTQLEVARSALDQEIKKRLWAEQELTQANLRLRNQAMRDPLTGLYNRRYLEESLDREESRARRSGQPLGLMLIDIDHFKRFNDTLGHAAGDTVLRAIGGYLTSAARGEDIVSRHGGDEFVLVMGHASQSALWERAERLRHGVQELEIEYDGRSVGPVTLSVGIAIYPHHGDSGHAVLRAADAALYRAKQAGRNRVVLGDEATA